MMRPILLLFGSLFLAAAAGLPADPPTTPAVEPAALPLTTILIPPHGTTEPVPWTVHVDDAPIRSVPDRSVPAGRRLPKGTAIPGEVLLREDTGEEWLEFELDGGVWYISSNSVNRVHPANRAGGDLAIGTEVVDRWWGLPLDYEPTDLQEVPAEFTDGRPARLRAEANKALAEMLRAAAAEGVRLRILSAYRSGARQRELYSRAVEGNPAQRHTAPPGHSEHQLGTTVDIEDAAGKHRLSRRFDQTPEGRWLQQNAWKFGWVQSYTPEEVEQTGYIAEPWHWRYHGQDRARRLRGS